IEVESVVLSEVLQKFEVIDFLKIDIEGAELKVLQESVKELLRVKNIALEVHTHPKEPQRLSEIFAILEKNGFRYHIHDINRRASPLINRESNGLFDCQANIFAYRVYE
ncbi:MAG: FkbM family methyltransferase, partial [Campylobacterales bacterium]